MSDMAILIAYEILSKGCYLSTAENVKNAMEILTDRDNQILWLRIQGRSYGEIGSALRMNKGLVCKIVNTRIRRSIYSVIERATCIA